MNWVRSRSLPHNPFQGFTFQIWWINWTSLKVKESSASLRQPVLRSPFSVAVLLRRINSTATEGGGYALTGCLLSTKGEHEMPLRVIKNLLAFLRFPFNQREIEKGSDLFETSSMFYFPDIAG
ncbi:MAG: hypothetical protein KAU01_06925 [Candidatus Cloacimonetes bacterium]|nr:hypothetical protein [Candidatus Cloacimonadota bacterium]